MKSGAAHGLDRCDWHAGFGGAEIEVTDEAAHENVEPRLAVPSCHGDDC